MTTRLRDGVRRAAPIAIAVFPFGVSFGLLARSVGMGRVGARRPRRGRARQPGAARARRGVPGALPGAAPSAAPEWARSRRRGCGGDDRPCPRPGGAAGGPDRRGQRGVSRRLAAAMSRVWLAVVIVGAATVVLKAAGPVLLGGRGLPVRMRARVGLLAPPLLAALAV